ncbi:MULTISPECIES: hypothetical protein [Cytobacillus]|uniref:Uncharacterized protein n=1 Tax=Cytobacillus horneckiae TaxID=549687 RepID=A0A2N0ZIF6_9BACI|nr:hypothetical protein [Cytobacillus horneckiae]MEC1159270.1 hypothetical protein [Cytobacillus horneckiae]PKG29276.1 hypothetical protein CWS20_09275 [Cytobacillus horneckiae]
MGRQIKCTESWDMGVGIGLQRGMEKYIDLYFDYMKNEYISKLNQINDRDLLEKMHDTIYTNVRNRHDFELLLNNLQHYHQEQKERDREKEKNR